VHKLFDESLQRPVLGILKKLLGRACGCTAKTQHEVG
jgi:hypothetical protein